MFRAGQITESTMREKGLSTIILILLALVILGGGGGYYFYQQQELKSVTDFKSCAKLYPVSIDSPWQCKTPDGRYFVKDLSDEEKRRLGIIWDFDSCVERGNPIEESSPRVCRADGKVFSEDEILYGDAHHREEATGSASMNIAEWKSLQNDSGYFLKYPKEYKVEALGMNDTPSSTYYLLISPDVKRSDHPNVYVEIYSTPKSQTVYKDMSLSEIAMENFIANKENKNSFIRLIKDFEKVSFKEHEVYSYALVSRGYSGKWFGYLSNPMLMKVIELEHRDKYFIIIYTGNNEVTQAIVDSLKLN